MSRARAEGFLVANRIPLVVAIAAVVVLIDQLTKMWALSVLDSGPIEIFGSVRLALTRNTAGAFGLGGAAVPFLALGAVALVIAITVRGTGSQRAIVAVALGLVLGGAFGNLGDRIFREPGLLRGAVVDFIDVGFWPVFNVADSAITCGCVVLLISSFGGRDT